MKSLPNNLWTSPVLIDRLGQEADFEQPAKVQFWFSVPQADTRIGNITLKNFDNSLTNIPPHELQQDFAVALRQYMQSEIHHDGLWMVGWTHPPASGNHLRVDGDNCWGRLVMIWLDEDGDPQFTVDSYRPFVQMMKDGISYYVNMCENAYAAFNEEYGKKAMKADLGIKEDQIKKDVLKSLH